MKYRTMRFIGGEENVSLLGLGCMRFPLNEDGTIDEAQAEAMIGRALNAGINYIDTAYPYHKGESEPFLGRALKKYPRNSFYLATKLPVWLVNSVEDAERLFKEQLSRLQTKYIDYYLLHALDAGRWEKLVKEGIIEWAEAKKASGKIRHLGFSAHGDLDVMKRFLEAYGKDMEFCQIQLNYVDWTFQKAKEKTELLAEYQIPVWVMEPLRGGKLANLSQEQEEKLKALRPEEGVPAWAFRFLQTVPGVAMVLSGMSNMAQLKDNIHTFETEKPLSDAEMKELLAMADDMVKRIALPCTACHYCVSHCPQGLDIPSLLALYNEHSFTQGGFIAPMALSAIPQEKWPSACICCRSCEAVCPQQIKISEAMSDFAGRLGA